VNRLLVPYMRKFIIVHTPEVDLSQLRRFGWLSGEMLRRKMSIKQCNWEQECVSSRFSSTTLSRIDHAMRSYGSEPEFLPDVCIMRVLTPCLAILPS